MATQSIAKQEAARLYYFKNRDKIRARSKARYEAKRHEINARQKQKRDNDLETFRAKERERYRANAEKMRANSLRSYRKNRTARAERTKVYRSKNTERVKEWKRRWLVNNRDKRRIVIRNNRDMRRRKGNGKFTLELLIAKYNFHGWRCYLCGTPITLQTSHPDHRKPLGRGGSNWIANIAPACIPCNLHKNRRTESEYRAVLGGSDASHKIKMRPSISEGRTRHHLKLSTSVQAGGVGVIGYT